MAFCRTSPPPFFEFWLLLLFLVYNEIRWVICCVNKLIHLSASKQQQATSSQQAAVVWNLKISINFLSVNWNWKCAAVKENLSWNHRCSSTSRVFTFLQIRRAWWHLRGRKWWWKLITVASSDFQPKFQQSWWIVSPSKCESEAPTQCRILILCFFYGWSSWDPTFQRQSDQNSY